MRYCCAAISVFLTGCAKHAPLPIASWEKWASCDEIKTDQGSASITVRRGEGMRASITCTSGAGLSHVHTSRSSQCPVDSEMDAYKTIISQVCEQA